MHGTMQIFSMTASSGNKWHALAAPIRGLCIRTGQHLNAQIIGDDGTLLAICIPFLLFREMVVYSFFSLP